MYANLMMNIASNDSALLYSTSSTTEYEILSTIYERMAWTHSTKPTSAAKKGYVMTTTMNWLAKRQNEENEPSSAYLNVKIIIIMLAVALSYATIVNIC